MGYAKAKSRGAYCKVGWCDRKVVALGMCGPHYQWNRYHCLHDMNYMVDYKERHIELARRADVFIPSVKLAKRGKLKLVR